MPITVPKHLEERYGERGDHFTKIFDALIEPAVRAAGLTPTGPARAGTENIQAAIINDLQGADLVLADLSALNPNVFLELGIRSALDRPVCLVWDGMDPLPFDSSPLYSHRYDPQPVYELNAEIERMAEFIKTTMSKSDGRNELWKFFGSASAALPAAELDPADATLHAKVDRLADIVEYQSTVLTALQVRGAVIEPSSADIADVFERVYSALSAAGPDGIHGSHVRAICVAILGSAYDTFLNGASLSSRLNGLGIPIRTNRSGQFILASAGPDPGAH